MKRQHGNRYRLNTVYSVKVLKGTRYFLGNKWTENALLRNPSINLQIRVLQVHKIILSPSSEASLLENVEMKQRATPIMSSGSVKASEGERERENTKEENIIIMTTVSHAHNKKHPRIIPFGRRPHPGRMSRGARHTWHTWTRGNNQKVMAVSLLSHLLPTLSVHAAISKEIGHGAESS